MRRDAEIRAEGLKRKAEVNNLVVTKGLLSTSLFVRPEVIN